MRPVAFFLAFIVLALSCMPCADSAYAMGASRQTTTNVKVPKQDTNSEHKDDCSPFCQCTCCAGFLVSTVFSTFKSLPFQSEKHFASFLPADIIEMSLPIWQPPQLAA